MSTELRGLALVVLLVGCKREDTAPTDVSAAVSDAVSTVITVTWKTADPTAGTVSFGLDGALDRRTPVEAEPTTDHRAVLVGIPAETDVSWQVDGEEEVHTTATGALPDYVPAVLVTGEGNDRFLTTTLVGDPENTIVLLDPDGAVVWYHRDTRGLSVFRSLVSRDGSGVVYASAIYNGGPSPDSAFVRVPWDGSTEEVVPVPNLAHDFVELPDLSLVAVNYVTQDDVLGSGLVQVDREGATTQLWTTWDCLDPVANPGDDPAHGWTHANAVDYLPDEDAFLVGLRNLGTLEHVARDGTCAWGFGGAGGTVAIDGPKFIHEHQFEKIDGGMLVFDNDGAPGNESRAIEYAFDEAAGTASLVTTFSHAPPLYSFIMGDVERLEDDDTLVLFSVPHVIDRMGPDGVVKWSVDFEGEALLGFFQPLADPYTVP